jgi:Fe-S cluster assembly protein SufD
MTQLAAEEKKVHVSNFRRFETELKATKGAGGASAAPAPAWLDALRRSGIARFEEVGFPSTKDEEWRFTNVAPIARTPFELGARRDLAGAPPFGFGADEAAAELVFVNGHYMPQLSSTAGLPRTVRVSSIAEAIRDDGALVEGHLGRLADVRRSPFVALNTGFVRDGAFVHVRRGTLLSRPIHLLFLTVPERDRPAVAHPRVLVVADDGVQATVVETYAGSGGAGPYFTNAVTEIVVGENAFLDHYKLQQELPDAYHVATMQVRVGRSGRFISHSATLGAKLTRNDLNVRMAGDGADATLNGLVILGGEQHCDNHTLLDHAAPNCPSHELYKHVLDGKSTGVFKGKILVRQPAQKTDSKQTSKSLLLSDDAYMNSQPALEIYADDVKCTHGSTTGPVDEDMVFYLRTRGVGLDAARHLLTYAFAADVTRRIKVDPVRRRLEDFLAAQHGLPQDLRITDLGAHDEAAR